MALDANRFAVYVALQSIILSSSNLILTASGSSFTSSMGPLLPYDLLYYSGVRAYFKEDWDKAAELLEKSIASKEAMRRFRKKCHEDCFAAGTDILGKLGITYLYY